MRSSTVMNFISFFTFLLLLDRTIILLAAPSSQSSPQLRSQSSAQISPLGHLLTKTEFKRAAPVNSSNNDEEEAAIADESEEGDSDDDDDGDDEVDGESENEESLASNHLGSKEKRNEARILTDIFGNEIKMENNRTLLVSQNKARDLGLLTIKAILLGPLIGLTIKAALIRGLLWAVGAYFLHLFFPGVLSALGLGSGLVGFARQAQPNYAALLMPHLANIPNNIHNILPTSFNRLVTQYRQTFVPVVESIRSIPEGHCRFKAVCETASNLIRSTQFMSTTLQRLSATVYLNFGTDYSKAWLDGIVQSDCAVKYPLCDSSPLNVVTSKLADVLRPNITY